jgi:hypothetical protein
MTKSKPEQSAPATDSVKSEDKIEAKKSMKYFARKKAMIDSNLYVFAGTDKIEPFEIAASEEEGWVELDKAQYTYLKEQKMQVQEKNYSKPTDVFELKEEN